MSREKSRAASASLKAPIVDDKDFLQEITRKVVHRLSEVEMSDALGAEPGAWTESRLEYRAGDYPRTVITRVCELELRVHRDRGERLSVGLFERYQRSEKALVSVLAEMYVQGFSPRKVKAITEEFIRPQLLRLDRNPEHKGPGQGPERVRHLLAGRSLLPGRKVREGTGRRSDSQPGSVHWRQHKLEKPPPGLKDGTRQPVDPDQLAGFHLYASEAWPAWGRVRGLTMSTMVSARAPWRYSRKRPASVATRTSYAEPSIICPAKPPMTNYRSSDNSAIAVMWMKPRGTSRLRLVAGRKPIPGSATPVEKDTAETLAFYLLPRGHYKHPKNTHLLERLNEEIKQRTRVVRIIPNQESYLRSIRALSVETLEGRLEEHRYLELDPLTEHKRKLLWQLEAIQEEDVTKTAPYRDSTSVQLDRHCPRSPDT